MIPRSVRTGVSASWLVGLGMLCLASLGALLAPWQGPATVLAEGGAIGGQRIAPTVLLYGPNDGEPINSRVLLLRMKTDCTASVRIHLTLHGRYLFDRLVQPGPARDPDGLLVTDIYVNLDEALRYTGINVLDPDAEAARFGVHVLSAVDGRYLGHAEWSGYVGKPWVELLPRTVINVPGVDVGTAMPAQGSPQQPGLALAALHALSKDMFYFLLAAPRRDLLALTPDEPRLLRESKILSSGPCYPTSGPDARPVPVASLVPLRSYSWPESYMVLWTYDTEKGWKRSVIQPVVLK